jgi:hypothetical protein
MEPLLDEFLGELSCLLPVRGSQRARALAEIEDHLLCAVEEGLAEGQSRPDAVVASLSRVGGARAVAASFAGPRAEHAVARAQLLTATCVLAFLVLFTLASQVTGMPAHHAIGAGAAAAVGWFAWQIAGAAGVVAWLHRRRPRAGDLGPSALALSLRAAAVAVACVSVALATDVVTLAGSQLSSRAGQGVAGGIGAAAVITAVTVCFLCRAAASVRSLRRLQPRNEPGPSALEELHDLARRRAARAAAAYAARFGPLPAALLAWAQRADRALRWMLARRRRAAAALGTLAGAGLAAGSIGEHGFGGGPRDALLTIAAAATVFAIEAVAIVICARVFDRLLHLWPS